ncbi:hypothetical protein MJH12_19850 [bacterium]|nr:hypothetical protein [bacterium]
MNIPSFKSLTKQQKSESDVQKETIAYLCEHGSEIEKSMLKEVIAQEEDRKIRDYYYKLNHGKSVKTVEVLDNIHSSIKKIQTNAFDKEQTPLHQDVSFSNFANLKRLGFSLGALVFFFSFGYKPIQETISSNSQMVKNTLSMVGSEKETVVIKREIHRSKGRKILALDIVVAEENFDLKTQFSKILQKEKSHYWAIRVRFFSRGDLNKSHHHLFASQEASKLMEDFENMYTSNDWVIVWE